MLEAMQDGSLLAAALDATSDAIVFIDAIGRIRSANKAAVTMFGFPPERLAGAHWRSILATPWEKLPDVGAAHAAMGRRPDGSIFPVECRLTRAADPGGGDPVTVCVIRDQTERRQLERRVLEARVQVRREIGRDLHDGLGQILTGTAFLVKALEPRVAPEYQPQAQRVVELINLAISRVRGIARGLSNLHLEAHNLEHALRDIVAESTMLLGVDCRLEVDVGVDVASAATIAQLYLIVREAITNAVRHGLADRIVVSLAREGARCRLSIEDNGIGIREPIAPREGIGLKSMRERAGSIGGSLEVGRGAGEAGTVVRCWW